MTHFKAIIIGLSIKISASAIKIVVNIVVVVEPILLTRDWLMPLYEGQSTSETASQCFQLC